MLTLIEIKMEGASDSSNSNGEISENMHEKMPNAASKSITHVEIITSDSIAEEEDMNKG